MLIRSLPLLPALLLATGLAFAADAPPPNTGALAAKLQPLIDHQVIGGAVMLVASKDKVIDLETVGYSDVAAKKPMAADDLFWIASMSKAITASGLMILVGEGKLSVDEPLEKYLPEFKNLVVIAKDDRTHTPHPADHPVLIREILSQTGGVEFRSKLEQETGPALDTRPLAEAVAAYAKTPLQSQPGAEFHYANANFNTAGRLIEVISGMPYEQFLQQRLFDPLGMRATTFWPTPAQLQRLAKGYTTHEDEPKLREALSNQLTYPLDNRKTRFPIPAGGLFSTAHDVGRFCQMLLNEGTLDGHRYLTVESVRKMTTDQTAPATNEQYGFGWRPGVRAKESGKPTKKKDAAPATPPSDEPYSHGGAFDTYMGVDPHRGIIVVFMIQHSGKFPTEEGKNVLSTFVNAVQSMVGTPGQPGAKTTTEGQRTE